MGRRTLGRNLESACPNFKGRCRLVDSRSITHTFLHFQLLQLALSFIDNSMNLRNILRSIILPKIDAVDMDMDVDMDEVIHGTVRCPRSSR